MGGVNAQKKRHLVLRMNNFPSKRAGVNILRLFNSYC